MDLWNTMVIVTRWYGGQKLGPRRFTLINQAARDAFVKAGLVNEGGAGTKKKGHGK
jgi:putative IMPACT (imprinted ancient) family translation regulator